MSVDTAGPLSIPDEGADDLTATNTPDLMAAQNIRRLAVMDAAGTVVGWVTLADLARRLLVDSDTVQQALRAATEQPA